MIEKTILRNSFLHVWVHGEKIVVCPEGCSLERLPKVSGHEDRMAAHQMQ